MADFTEDTAERLAEAVQQLASESKTANLIAYAAVLRREVEEQEASLGPEGGTTTALQRVNRPGESEDCLKRSARPVVGL